MNRPLRLEAPVSIDCEGLSVRISVVSLGLASSSSVLADRQAAVLALDDAQPGVQLLGHTDITRMLTCDPSSTLTIKPNDLIFERRG